MGFEPTTASLEGWNSTTELRPPFPSSVLSSSWFRLYTFAQHATLACVMHVVGRQGFEPWKPMATDLQSAPFGHLGTCPKHLQHATQKNKYGILIIAFLFHRNDEKRKASPVHARLPFPKIE
jgi:hypothetical protein